jgi:hypothetical protein
MLVPLTCSTFVTALAGLRGGQRIGVILEELTRTAPVQSAAAITPREQEQVRVTTRLEYGPALDAYRILMSNMSD